MHLQILHLTVDHTHRTSLKSRLLYTRDTHHLTRMNMGPLIAVIWGTCRYMIPSNWCALLISILPRRTHQLRFAKEPAVKTPSAAAANDSWLSSLERVETPPPRTPPVSSPPPIVAPRPRLPEVRGSSLSAIRRESMDKDDSRALVQDQTRKIAALEAEKASLSSSIEQLKHTESSMSSFRFLISKTWPLT